MDTMERKKSEMAIMDHTGDTKIVWDPENDVEVDHAEKTFNEFKKKGYLAYKVDKKGNSGEIMRKFDKDEEKMILTPQMKGG